MLRQDDVLPDSDTSAVLRVCPVRAPQRARRQGTMRLLLPQHPAKPASVLASLVASVASDDKDSSGKAGPQTGRLAAVLRFCRPVPPVCW